VAYKPTDFDTLALPVAHQPKTHNFQTQASGYQSGAYVALFWLAVTLFLAGCGRPQVESLSRSDLFRLHCSSCHGDGSGNGHIAATLPIRPRNLRHADWQDNVNDERILNVIRFGGLPYKLSDRMPGFADKLSEAQIKSLMQYIRSFRMQ
jgi:mono/diheme cytochrome c family protein